MFCNVTCHVQLRIKILFSNEIEHVPEVTVELKTK